MLFKSTLFVCAALTQVLAFAPSVSDAACRLCMPEPVLEPIVIEPRLINGGQQGMNRESGRTSRETIELAIPLCQSRRSRLGALGF
jgi:hypothetical protein